MVYDWPVKKTSRRAATNYSGGSACSACVMTLINGKTLKT